MSQLAHKPEILDRARRIVVKVGSAVLSDHDGLRGEVIANLAGEVAAAMNGGHEVVLVSSGAIAAGRTVLGQIRAKNIAARQAAAATGQIELMAAWRRAFADRGLNTAQILLTHQDLAERHRRNNASQTLRALIGASVVPIVNENDTVSVDEIRLGDNDVLSSLVATLIEAQLLVILSDVDGVLTGDPRKHPGSRLIPLINSIEAPLHGLVAERPGPLGSGGMVSKLKAARQAVRAGIAVVIASGRTAGSLTAVLDAQREAGTLILPAHKPMVGRKHWIAFALRPLGTLTVDSGASEALQKRGRSLLPSGVSDVRGDFTCGDCVSLVGPDGVEFGRGLVNYPAADVIRIKGKRTTEIGRLLGYKLADEIIHRDNFVLLQDLA